MRNRTGMQVVMREFAKDKWALMLFIVLVAMIVGIFIGASLIHQETMMRISLQNYYAEPSKQFLLGADQGGRDILGQLIVGARNSVAIAMAITCITSIVGTLVGLVCGYFGSWIDRVVMRIIDFYMTIPSLMLIIVFISIVPQYTILSFVVIMSLFLWVGTARIVRAKTLSESRRDYVYASKTMGTSDIVIMFREVAPNISSIVIVEIMLNFASNIGIETGLSYLGFGLPPTIPSLGTLISYANNPLVLQQKWWVWLPASIFILLFTLCIHYIGQAFRRIADVRQRSITPQRNCVRIRLRARAKNSSPNRITRS